VMVQNTPHSHTDKSGALVGNSMSPYLEMRCPGKSGRKMFIAIFAIEFCTDGSANPSVKYA